MENLSALTLTESGSIGVGLQNGESGFDSVQFGEEIQTLITVTPDNASSFTALLELPANQAMELLHHVPESNGNKIAGDPLHNKPFPQQLPFGSNLTFLSDPALIERASKFSVFAGGQHSPETTSSVPSNSSANLDKVKNEPTETDSNPNSSQPLVSDPMVEEKSQKPLMKRKEREKKAKVSSKKSKNEIREDAEKLPYVHVRARRGQATDSHSLAERARREKINARMKLLQELVPGCSKISGTALVLDEIINHVQSLQRQVEFLSMRLAAVNPRIDFNLDNILATANGSVMEGSLPNMGSPLMWPEFPLNGNRQQYQQQWHLDAIGLQQPLWGRQEDSHTFVTPENSLLTYDSSANSVSTQSTRHKSPQTISVTDFGATGDGIRYDTTAIQSAIDACSGIERCRVVFPPGTYLTATVRLKSGVVLEVGVGATILGGMRMEDYPREQSEWYVVLAENATDVGITGGGAIDGQSWGFVERFDEKKNVMVSWNRTGACSGDECRPRLVGFIGCKNVVVSNVFLTKPAYWCLHIVRCENISIHDVQIYGDFNTPNNDGIDIEDSNNTIITRCHIDTGDDAICPKTYTGPLYNLTATDCWIRTKSSAIKLGSASWFDFKGLVFDNITIVDSHRGLGLQIRDGGNVSDVTFSNININTRYYDPSWWGRAEPIYVTTCPRDSSSKEGSISNINFVNITVISENGIFLSGSEGGELSNLRFINMNVTYKRWTKYDGGLVDYRPGCQGLVHHSSAGLLMEHINGLEVENVNMKWSGARSRRWNIPLDFRSATVNNISMLNFHTSLLKQ
ncbi:hypothetical protein F8388_020779 [Cannabis sativa]|uniref:BHLH domain-containing protein n=1 Tax=Cannabis sativa TaxID=3483 RepID=A0A7J6EZX3_CANSA|nr:hypothetical protein F8388_020779 [Cannabis sativa]